MAWTPSTKALPILDECPTGMILRESPHIYSAIDLYGYAEAGGVDPFRCSPWARHAMMIIAGEKHRHWKMEDAQRKAKRDADIATSMVRRG